MQKLLKFISHTFSILLCLIFTGFMYMLESLTPLLMTKGREFFGHNSATHTLTTHKISTQDKELLS